MFFVAVCLVWTLIAGGLTGITVALGVVGPNLGNSPLAIFYLLGETRFATILSIPYVIILVFVIISDSVALAIAIKHRGSLKGPGSSGRKGSETRFTSLSKSPRSKPERSIDKHADMEYSGQIKADFESTLQKG